jgi:polyisoprenoid-binding protein YceI
MESIVEGKKTRRFTLGYVLCVVGGLVPLGPARAADSDVLGRRFEAQEGIVEFTATTNVPALEVHGQGAPSRASVVFHREGQRLVLQKLEARLPVAALSTGMGLRDRHMREQVFQRPDGSLPDVVFVAEQAFCAAGPCVVTGQLTVRGEARPFKATLKIDATEGDHALAVSGEGVVHLSDYGITQPRQLGVTVANDVAVKFRMSGRLVGIAAR